MQKRRPRRSRGDTTRQADRPREPEGNPAASTTMKRANAAQDAGECHVGMSGSTTPEAEKQKEVCEADECTGGGTLRDPLVDASHSAPHVSKHFEMLAGKLRQEMQCRNDDATESSAGVAVTSPHEASAPAQPEATGYDRIEGKAMLSAGLPATAVAGTLPLAPPASPPLVEPAPTAPPFVEGPPPSAVEPAPAGERGERNVVAGCMVQRLRM